MTTAQAAEALDSITRSTLHDVGAGGDLLDALGSIRLIELAADQYRHAIVREARANGVTWQQIADALNVTRQSAHERFGATAAR